MNPRIVVISMLLLLSKFFTGTTASADPLRVYQIGNSWTCLNQGAWDIANSLGSQSTHGLHIAWNQTLTSLWAGQESFSSPANLHTALSTMQWDVVWMQPWYENYLQATEAATNMAMLAFQQNPNAKILIFACGPESSQGPYLTTWNRTDVANYTNQNFWKSKKNYELIVDNLRTAFPGKQIGIVPMGHCIAKVASILASGGTVPGITSVDQLLEQGGQHTTDRGTYIGQLAAYCTMFQQRPHNSTFTNLANCQAAPLSITPEFAAFMWDMVWDVVLNEPYTLVKPTGTNNLAAFNFPGLGTATITGTNVAITVPYGTNVTALSPTFNLSEGATCNPPSGSTQNFTSPVHYVVSSAEPVTTQDFTVTVTIAPYEPPIIGVQRAGGIGGSGTQLTADQRAGPPGYAQSNWNTMGFGTSSATALKDSKGAVTTAAFTSNTDGISSQNMGTASTQPDEILHSNSQIRIWGDQTFNITGIPYSSYKLVFYETAPGAHGSQATILTGGPTYYLSQTYVSSAAGYVDNNASTPYTYIQATSTTAGAPTVDGNYVVFSGLTGTSQTVTIPGGFLVNNAFNAFQIVDTSVAAAPAADINSFDFGTLGAGTISGTGISITVPFGTNVTSLSSTFTLSAGATCNRTSGSAQNFSSPITYTVTSSDSLITKTYTVTVTVAAASTAADMQSFNFGVLGAATISGTNITISVPYGTAVSALAPTYAVSPGATCLPASGSSQNFGSPVHYVVTSQAGSPSKDYTVTVSVAAASSAKDMLTFGPGATINSTTNTISWTVPNGTNVTTLAPVLTFSPLATSSPASGNSRNFTTPQTYRVTAQDGSFKDYAVTVTVAAPLASGARIGVQIAGGLGGTGDTLSASETAGAPGFAQDHWNVTGSFTGGGSALKDNTGATTTAGFTATGFSYALGINNASGPDEKLNSAEHFQTWGDVTISLANIPYANYSLIVYGLTKFPHGAQSMALASGPTYYYSQTVGGDSAGYVDNNASTPFTYTRATGTSSGTATDNGNYIVFSGLTGASQTLTAFGGFQTHNSISAFQIVDTTPTQTHYESLINSAAYNTPPLSAAQKLPTADPDGDGLTNQQEYAFGLNPTSGSSCNPISVPLNKAIGTFSYTRRATPAITGLAYTIWTSNDMQQGQWTQDTGATEGTVSTVDGVETVPVTLSPALLSNATLFVRVKAQ